MKKNYLVKIYLSAISLCLLSFSSNAQFFSATTAPQCNTTTGGTEVVNILGATANAAGNATLTVYYTGDLDLSTELIDFYGESSLTTPIGTSTPATAQCFAGYDSVVLTVPMADINNWASDGTVTITAVASSSVSGSVCSGWCIYMKLEYPIVTGPCTSPPTPGNASVSNTTPCPSGDISFNLSGNSFGAGQTYEWQVATSVNGPFTPISGPLSFPSFSTTAPSSAGIYYYTAAVTCSSSPVTTSFSDTISITVPALFPSATYTINGAQPTGGTNFQTFADAVNAMSCGIAGPIIFNVSPGTYSNDSLYLDSLNTSATNTITFNGGGATLNHDGNSVNFATIRLNNTGYVTINNLTVTTTGTGSNYGIEFTGQSSNNTIANCTIVADTTSTSSTNMGIVFDGTANSYSTQGDNSNNTITGCTVIGGYYNIVVYGNTTSNNTGNVFTNNILQNSYTYSLYLYANANATISGNDMSQPTRTNVSTSGTLISSCTGGIIYEKNRIHDLFVGEPASTSAAYCIYFSASDATSINPNTINNNLIYNINNAGGTIYGIYNSSSDYTSIYHNTIVLDDNTVTTSETTRAIFLTGTTAAPVVGADIKNNILVVQRSGTGTNHCIYLDDAPSTTSDNNDYYVGGAATNYVGFLTGPGDQTTLLDWQTNSSQDASSQAVNPVFNNSASGDYTPFSAAIDNIGFPVGITTDILNAARSTSTPDIGAYEFNVPVCSPTGLTAGAASASPSVLCAGGTVTFGLTGQSTGAGITFSWQSSPFATGPFNTVNTDITSSYTATVFAPEYYRCEVVCGSTVVYSDTIFVNAISPLAGTYTIDQNSATSPSNFQSFADAMTALNCGISGPVVFDVVPGSGPYNERIELPSGLVTSVGNTLRINGNGNWLHWSTTTSAQRAAVLIDGHDYVTIDSLNIDVRGGTYGYGVHLINDADNDTISNCVIITDSASTSSNFMGISLSGSATSYSTAGDNNYVVIDGNTIVGGYYGLVSYGSSSEIAMDNIYRNNTITETYYDGIYLYYSSNPTITNNDISKPYRSDVTTSSGIYMGSCSGGGLIARNKIHNLHGGEPTATSDNYGIEFSSTDGTATTPYIIANNLIYDMTGNGDIYGFYNSASDFCKYYFNTVSLDNASSTTTLTTRGIYQTTAVNGFEFRNNIVTITRGGTGTNHGLYFNTAGTITNGAVLDNNVYYVAGTGVNNIGYHTSNSHTTLTAWSASFTPPQETLSVEVDPLYTDIATHNYIPTRLVVNDIGFQVGILTDINNVPRSSTPDPGAYEWTPPPCVTPPVAGNVVVSDTLLCQGENLTLDLVGNSIGTGQTYQWQQATSPTGTFTNVPGSSVASTPLFTTAPTATMYYRNAVTCSGNTEYSDTILVKVNLPLAGGTYTVNDALPTAGLNFNSLQEAAEAMSCGITGAVVLDVAPGSGPYVNQQMVFPNTLVTSATNTITINGNGATLISNAQDGNQRAAIALYGTDYVTIDSLIIDASTGAYNWGIFFTEQADHNRIENSTIISSKTATSSADAGGIVFSASNTATTTNGNNGNFDTIINNTIIGGYYGISVYGASTTPHQGNVISNNISQDAHAYNILSVYGNGTIISDNDVSRPTRTVSTTFAGIYVNNPSTNVRVLRNRVHNLFDAMPASTSTCYPIYFGAADATLGNENVIANNLVYNINNAGGTIYGLYNSSSDFCNYYYNTIVLDDQTVTTTETTRGFYQTSSASTINVKNNIFVVQRSGTGTNHGIYFNTTGTTWTADDNNYYVGGATNNYIGQDQANTDYSTLAAWQAATTQDGSSDTLNPYFANLITGDLTPTNPLMDNLGNPIAGITTDFSGSPRSAVTPDYGAIEFVPPTCPPPTQVTASNVTGTSATVSWMYVNGNVPASGYDYYYNTTGAIPTGSTTPIGSGTTAMSENLTGLTGGTEYYVWVRSKCSGIDISDWSQPVIFKTNPANDSAINATLLVVGTTTCNGTNYNGDVGGATQEPNEPIISCEQRTNATTSVWYKFDAPTSGMVKISTDYAVDAYDSLTDSKLGVYSVTDSSDFATYQIVGCDEDNGTVGTGWRNILYLADLTPGNRYYIKVDKNDAANPDAAFCIDVMPMTSTMISTNDNCSGTAYNNNSSWHNGGTAWVSKLDDAGLLIYNMKTNVNTALGDMPDKFYEQSGAARVYQSTPYLNRNYEITSVNPPTSPITLQFFFTDADFTSLQTANPATTMANLNVTRLDNGTCSNVFDATGATATLLTQTANGAANGVRFINVNTPGFSSFFIHANNNPLVIKLGKIAAVNLGNDNRVDWNTVSEEVSDRFELEHSVDGRNFEKIADVKAIGEPSTYSYLDKNAVKGINYYRLKMIDITNEFAYSPVVSAIVKGENVFVVEAFPNPVKDLLYIRTTGTQGMNAQIHITDISGKLLQQKTVNSNATEIDMKPFASGVYFIKYVDDVHSETIRISKQ